MAVGAAPNTGGRGTTTTRELEAVIIGVGVAGLHQLHQLRSQGLQGRAYDAAADVGGTWFWNRYPGAQTEWISDLIRHLRASNETVIEPTESLQDARVAHHDEAAGANLISRTSSWHLGANVPGKPRRVLFYTGGVGTYREKCQETAAAGHPGFDLH